MVVGSSGVYFGGSGEVYSLVEWEVGSKTISEVSYSVGISYGSI